MKMLRSQGIMRTQLRMLPTRLENREDSVTLLSSTSSLEFDQYYVDHPSSAPWYDPIAI